MQFFFAFYSYPIIFNIHPKLIPQEFTQIKITNI